jgi:hypothetical protein
LQGGSAKPQNRRDCTGYSVSGQRSSSCLRTFQAKFVAAVSARIGIGSVSLHCEEEQGKMQIQGPNQTHFGHLAAIAPEIIA